MVVPDVEVGLTTLEWPHRMIPMVDVLQTLAMTHTATRETHELRMQVGNNLGEVLSQAVLTAHKGLLWEKRHHIDTYTGHLLGDDDQTTLLVAGFSLEYRRELLPVGGTGL